MSSSGAGHPTWASIVVVKIVEAMSKKFFISSVHEH
jgi:hypothetical protein